MANEVFSASKIALLCENKLLVYQRDNFNHIPFPNFWDLPGGNRENDETPEECALRELQEEFGLKLDQNRIIWKRRYQRESPDHLTGYFFVAHLKEGEISLVKFGDEGQRWKMDNIADFLASEKAVPHLVAALQEYLKQAPSV